MPNKKLLKESFEKLCNELKNDLNGKSIKNDITSNYLLDDSSEFKCEISNRENIILCGAEFVRYFFKKKFPKIKIHSFYKDGAKLKKNSQITTITNNKKFDILTKDLFKGSVSFNLGEIDTPAILFNKIPNFKEWNFQKKITLPLKKDDNVYIKIKQKNNQICWTSPFFIK